MAEKRQARPTHTLQPAAADMTKEPQPKTQAILLLYFFPVSLILSLIHSLTILLLLVEHAGQEARGQEQGRVHRGVQFLPVFQDDADAHPAYLCVNVCGWFEQRGLGGKRRRRESYVELSGYDHACACVEGNTQTCESRRSIRGRGVGSSLP